MSPSLNTRYLGLELRSPFVASASPLTGDLDGLARLEAAGAGAVVLPSLFEEQIEHEEQELARLAEFGSDTFAEAHTILPELTGPVTGPRPYLERIEKAKQRLSIPVIASLNGHTPGGWESYARAMQDAGADAVELNIYYVPVSIDESAADVEQRYLDIVAGVRAAIDVPLAVKIGPAFTALPHFARSLVERGADGLVLFNRLLRPDMDLETMTLEPSLELSGHWDLRLPLQWVAVLFGRVEASLAASGGVQTGLDAAKLILAGADVVMATSSLLRRGAGHVATILHDLEAWMTEKEYASVEQMRGSMSHQNCPDPSAYERANYMRALVSYTSELI